MGMMPRQHHLALLKELEATACNHIWAQGPWFPPKRKALEEALQEAGLVVWSNLNRSCRVGVRKACPITGFAITGDQSAYLEKSFLTRHNT
jgi:hypothetical protein